MPEITPTEVSQGFQQITETTLNGVDDTLVYSETASALLTLRNPTGGTITPNIDGDEGTTVEVPGVGEVDVSGGISQAIAAGEVFSVRLGTINEYLRGAITITNGTDLVATLIQ